MKRTSGFLILCSIVLLFTSCSIKNFSERKYRPLFTRHHAAPPQVNDPDQVPLTNLPGAAAWIPAQQLPETPPVCLKIYLQDQPKHVSSGNFRNGPSKGL